MVYPIGVFSEKVILFKNMTYEEKYYDKANQNEGDKSSLRNAVAGFLASHAKEGDLILEVGCGSGILIPGLPRGVVYTGVDVSSYGLSQARARFKAVSFIEASSDKLPFNSGAFLYVVSVFALEHFPKPKESLDEIIRVLKPGGYLLLLAPNLEFPFARLNAIRHLSLIHRMFFMVKRIGDYFLRLFGVFTFRTIAENYTETTGRYDRPDDDLTYAVSSFEVINYLSRRHSLRLLAGGVPTTSSDWCGHLRKIVQFLPAMRYYGGVLFVVMEKPHERKN